MAAWRLPGRTASGGHPNQFAGWFSGNVHITGILSGGTASTLMDHPLDPANRYLAHAAVASPDMLNVYSGSIYLGRKGTANVRLPRYFDALNSDGRIQLTAVGAPAPGLHVARDVENGRFGIAGGAPEQKVFWQVTGVRRDAWAQRNRTKVDSAKSAADRGHYLAPEAHGKAREAGIGYRTRAGRHG